MQHVVRNQIPEKKKRKTRKKPIKVRQRESKKFSEPQNEIKAETWQVSKDQSKLRIKAWLSS